jgi:hypothetical protein
LEIHDYFQLFLNKNFSGTHLVACWDTNSLISLMSVNTIAIPTPQTYKIHFIEAGQCHENVYDLWKQDKNLKTYTGYALSQDRLWRHHSWCVDQTGTLIETTFERLIYIGYETKLKSDC